MPRDQWLAFWEQNTIIDFYARHPLEGYRRLAFMMLDQDIAAVSPASVYRVLSGVGLLDRSRVAQRPAKLACPGRRRGP